MTYVLTPCPRPGCTKRHGVQVSAKRSQSTGSHQPAKPMAAAASQGLDVGSLGTSRRAPRTPAPAQVGAASES